MGCGPLPVLCHLWRVQPYTGVDPCFMGVVERSSGTNASHVCMAVVLQCRLLVVRACVLLVRSAADGVQVVAPICAYNDTTGCRRHCGQACIACVCMGVLHLLSHMHVGGLCGSCGASCMR